MNAPALTESLVLNAGQSVSAPASLTLRPKVSILLITYNHEKYIAQAIESILMQVTEYSYEINVIEDCSTDRTQEIVMRYVEKYPHIVKPFFNKKNIGYKVTQKNFYRGFKTLTGEYLAILEGDDYWTSPHKMQKQVAFLETHPDFAICAHNTVKVYEGGDTASHRFLYWGQQPDKDIQDAVRLRSFFHTTGLIYRNVFRGVPPKQFRNKWSCDIFIFIAHAQFGKIHHIDEDMAVYRAHDSGRFSNMPLIDAWMFNIDGLRRYNAWLNYRYLNGFSEAITRLCATVLSGAGTGEIAALNIRQKIKCWILIGVYGSINYFLGLPGRSRKILSRGNQYGVPVLPVTVFFSDLIQSLYKLAKYAIPDSTKNSMLRFEKSHPGVRHLRLLTEEGKLFTRAGMHHLLAVGRQTVAKIMARIIKFIYKLAKYMMPDSTKNSILRFEKSHAGVRHLRLITEEGKLFTKTGMQHLLAVGRQTVAKVITRVRGRQP